MSNAHPGEPQDAPVDTARSMLRGAAAVVKASFHAMAICDRSGSAIVRNAEHRQLETLVGPSQLAASARTAIAHAPAQADIRIATALILRCHAVELGVPEDRRLYVVACKRGARAAGRASTAALQGIRENLSLALALLEQAPPAEADELTPLRPLTTIEQKVFVALIAGFRVSSIARELHVSESTIRSHLRAIFAKHGVHSQAALFDKILAYRKATAQVPSTKRTT